MGVWGQKKNPAASNPGKDPVPIYRRLGEFQGLSGKTENLVPNGIFF